MNDDQKKITEEEVVLQTALSIAFDCISKCEQVDLEAGGTKEEQEIAGKTWHFTVGYSKEHNGVEVSGHVHPSEEEAEDLTPEVLAGDGVVVVREPNLPGSFEYRIPVPWVKSVYEKSMGF